MTYQLDTILGLYGSGLFGLTSDNKLIMCRVPAGLHHEQARKFAATCTIHHTDQQWELCGSDPDKSYIGAIRLNSQTRYGF
jgi:hypothetical protein